MCDNVKHPEHYTKGNIECIDAIKESMSREAFEGYLKGNIIKYMWRYEDKNGLEDLCKAQTYLNWLIQFQIDQDTELSPKVKESEEYEVKVLEKTISVKDLQLGYIKTLFNILSFDLVNCGSVIIINQDIANNSIIEIGFKTDYLDDRPNVTKLLDTALHGSASFIKYIKNENEYNVATIDCTDLDKEVTETLFNCLDTLIEIDSNCSAIFNCRLRDIDGPTELEEQKIWQDYD